MFDNYLETRAEDRSIKLVIDVGQGDWTVIVDISQGFGSGFRDHHDSGVKPASRNRGAEDACSKKVGKEKAEHNRGKDIALRADAIWAWRSAWAKSPDGQINFMKGDRTS